MQLFKQDNFSRGLDAEYSRIKPQEGAYPLLINGRTRSGVPTPVKQHKKITGLPHGILQDIAVVGDLLIAIVAGKVFYRNLAGDNLWNSLSANAILDTTVDEVYTRLLPVTSNFFNLRGEPDWTNNVFNANIASQPQALYASDGLNPAVLINASGFYTTAGDYNTWSQNDPTYIPVGTIPCVSGQKFFLVSQDKKVIYQSVSGRATDFMVNRDTNGNKGGPANTMQIAVDYNDITALIPTQDNGLMACTLYATYFIFPDTNAKLFGEYRYRSEMAFPVGCVNHKSIVDLVGDTAFITQTGIQSFNVASQLKRESNNFPLGAKIQRYLANPQYDTAAINFDDYALFSMNTTFGRAVVIYDTIREQFVSIDTGFGTVKKFAIYRASGQLRLFFSNTDDELYEAYAGEEYAILRILLGDYSAQDAAAMHAVDKLYASFTNIRGEVPVELSVYSDNRLVQTTNAVLTSNSIVTAAPTVYPFVQAAESDTLDIQLGRKMLGLKTTVWLAWQGYAELVGIACEGSIMEAQGKSIDATLEKAIDDKIIVFGNTLLGTPVIAVDYAKAENLIKNEHYVVTGNVHNGGQIITDGVFIMPATTAYVDGTLANCESLYQLREKFIAERPTAIVTTGGVANPAGALADVTRLSYILAPLNLTLQGASGAVENATASGTYWFNKLDRYYNFATQFVEFFVLDSNTGDLAAQLQWLAARLSTSTKPFKIVVVNGDPYTDSATNYPGNAALRADYSAMGASLVISGKSTVYERFYIDGFPYIVNGCGGKPRDGFEPMFERSVARSNLYDGYLRIEASRFQLTASFVDLAGIVRDATTLYAGGPS